jgi:hypothetical protein
MQGVRLVTLGVAATLALAGCGDDSGGDAAQSAGNGDAKQSAKQPGAETSGSDQRSTDAAGDRSGDATGTGEPSAPDSGQGDEAAVKAAVERLYGDIAAADAQGVCSAMSMTAQEQIARQVPGGTPTPQEQRTCEASMSKYLRAATQSGAAAALSRVVVGRAAVRGRSATVQVTLGSKTGPVRLSKEGSRWVFGPGAVAR